MPKITRCQLSNCQKWRQTPSIFCREHGAEMRQPSPERTYDHSLRWQSDSSRSTTWLKRRFPVGTLEREE